MLFRLRARARTDIDCCRIKSYLSESKPKLRCSTKAAEVFLLYVRCQAALNMCRFSFLIQKHHQWSIHRAQYRDLSKSLYVECIIPTRGCYCCLKAPFCHQNWHSNRPELFATFFSNAPFRGRNGASNTPKSRDIRRTSLRKNHLARPPELATVKLV